MFFPDLHFTEVNRIHSMVNVAPCTNCKKGGINRSKGLQCVICQEWTHINCCEVPTPLYDQLIPYERNNVLFVCDGCYPRVLSLRKDAPATSGSSSDSSTVCDPDVTCIANNVQVESNSEDSDWQTVPSTSTPRKPKRLRRRKGLDQIDKKLTAKSIKSDTKRNAVEVIHPPCEKTPLNITEQTVKAASMQMQQPAPLAQKGQPSREQCVIVLNIPESSFAIPQQRLNADLEELRSCFTKIFVDGEEELAAAVRVMSAFRLGKRPTADSDAVHSRTLKVVLNSEEEAQSILRRTYRLQGTPVRILRDLSPNDRLKLKQALTELRQRRANGESDLFIRDFRVMKRKPRVRWEPLKIQLIPTAVEENKITNNSD